MKRGLIASEVCFAVTRSAKRHVSPSSVLSGHEKPSSAISNPAAFAMTDEHNAFQNVIWNPRVDGFPWGKMKTWLAAKSVINIRIFSTFLSRDSYPVPGNYPLTTSKPYRTMVAGQEICPPQDP
jgi:hypothetical protein